MPCQKVKVELVQSARQSRLLLLPPLVSSLKAGGAIQQERKEDATYLAAASGLHHLMNAAISTMD